MIDNLKVEVLQQKLNDAQQHDNPLTVTSLNSNYTNLENNNATNDLYKGFLWI